jgi:hypothetical protein
VDIRGRIYRCGKKLGYVQPVHPFLRSAYVFVVFLFARFAFQLPRSELHWGEIEPSPSARAAFESFLARHGFSSSLASKAKHLLGLQSRELQIVLSERVAPIEERPQKRARGRMERTSFKAAAANIRNNRNDDEVGLLLNCIGFWTRPNCDVCRRIH